MKILLILFSTLLMNACSCQKKTTENNMKTKLSENTPKEKISGKYTVQLLADNEISAKKVTLNFNSETKTVSGFSGCNHFSGKYKQTEGNILFSSIMSTKMACLDNDTEQVFMKALSNTTNFQLKKGALILKSDSINVLTAQSEKKMVTQQENKNIVVYGASTRGFFQEIALQKNRLLVRNDRNSKKAIEILVSDEEMEAIKILISEIDLKTINTLASPTNMRQYDGAAHAGIRIVKKEKTYRSAGFDAGHPPKELEALVNKIISLSQNK